MLARFAIVLGPLLLLVPNLARAEPNAPPKGFTALFDGDSLGGWHGLGTVDPRKLAAVPADERAKRFEADKEDVARHWSVKNGEIFNDGEGVYLTTDKDYGDIELFVDYLMHPKGDSGIYLRGCPQVQIWDYTEEAKFKIGADKGSGGLWNNSPGAAGKDPLIRADKPFGEWNTFHIIQTGARTTVYLNDKLVVDAAILENYFDRKLPIPARGPIQLQTHGSEIRWRNIYVREIPADEANRLLAAREDTSFEVVFNGKDFSGWKGPTDNYEAVDGVVRCKPHKGGCIFTEASYGDFVVRLEVKLPKAGNNGLAIRYPGTGDPAYSGMCELQVLDDADPTYAKIDPRQSFGSAYGIVAAQRGYLRPVGEWNFEEVTVRGSSIKVELNGTPILDADLSKVSEFMGKSAHPGKDAEEGHFGFAGHGDAVEFRNVRIKRL